MRISEKFLRVVLVGLILASVGFTYGIWLSPANKTPEVDSNNQTISNEQSYAKASDAFLPIRGIWDSATGKFQTNSENLLATAQARLTEGTYSALKLIADDQLEFEKYTNLSDGIELNYEGVFSLAEYIKVFDMPIEIKELSNRKQINFSKIQLDFANNKIRFLNFNTKKVYEADMDVNHTKLNSLYKKNSGRFIAMTTEDQIIPRLLQTENSIKLQRYSYILTTQSYSLFRNAFFQEANQVKSEDNTSEDTTFVSGNEQLIMKESNRQVDFSGDLPESIEKNSIYSQTFHYVSKLGTGVGNLRYFDRSQGMINYRIFVEGYPVFSSSAKGKMSVTIGSNSSDANANVVISTSMDTVQVPIPSDEEIELVSSATMENQLSNAGIDLSKLQSYIIGYTWSDIDGANKLVSLTPEWYVKYNDQWYSASQLISGETEAN